MITKINLLALLTILTLTACGGGGDSPSTETGPEVVTLDPIVADKTFKVSASAIVIKRISNDETVSVDISTIQSEELVLKGN